MPRTAAGSPLLSGFRSVPLGARQLALSCDPIVLLECVANLILRFAICRRQSFDDLVQPRCEVD